MQFNMISYTLFIFVTVMVFPSLIFALWTKDNPPRKPLSEEELKLPCSLWIEYSGFTLDNFNKNIEKAKDRDFALDKDASIWAAIYAFHIDEEVTPPELLPEQFCKRYRYDDFTYPFSPLKAEIRTCKGWITLYGFIEDEPINNIAYANDKVVRKMFEVSIWTYSYYRYVILLNNKIPMKPSEFCAHSMGADIGESETNKGFISTYDQVQCKVWIEQYDYTSDIENNLCRANRFYEADSITHIKIHFLPSAYAKQLQNLGEDEAVRTNLTPEEYCRTYLRATSETTYNFHYFLSELPKKEDE